MSTVLQELDETELVAGRARAWVLLAVTWARASRGKDAQLEDAAVSALALARSVRDARAEGNAQWQLGRVLLARGKLAEAQIAIGENLAISRRLAHYRVGGVLEAQAAFAEALAINRRLAEQDSLKSR